jgi:hypothetical protein
MSASVSTAAPAMIKRTEESLFGRPSITATSWVGVDRYSDLHLTEPFVYGALTHLGIGANFLGLMDASSLAFFRICTRKRPRQATAEDREKRRSRT